MFAQIRLTGQGPSVQTVSNILRELVNATKMSTWPLMSTYNQEKICSKLLYTRK